MDLVKKYITEAEAHIVAQQRAQYLNLQSVLSSMQFFKYYTKRNLGYKREELPQIPAEEIDTLILHFGSYCKVKKIRKPISAINPSQGYLNHNKLTAKLAKRSTQWIDRAYVCGQKMQLVDGHHDFANGMEVNPNQEVTIYLIDLPFKELIRRIKIMKISHKRDLQDKLIELLLNGKGK